MKYFLFAALLLASLPLLIQNGSPKSDPTPAKASVPDPFSLTEPEKLAKAEIEARFRPVQVEMDNAIRGIIQADGDDKILIAAYKLKMASGRADEIKKEFLSWLKAAQDSRKCPTCYLDGEKLMKPPEKGKLQ